MKFLGIHITSDLTLSMNTAHLSNHVKVKWLADSTVPVGSLPHKRLNKTDERKLRIVSAKIDSCVAIVTKIWLDNNIPDAAVELAGRALFSGQTGLQPQRNTEELSTYHRELNAKLGLEELYCMISLQMNKVR
ncbi:hypothetical protein L3Q82_000711 [Scortum barcoo]|uniref:Uncharacterized protein n=1 Tax=Scortum barcoo TaxID=214431 RepID=A0ACB8WDA6_9TELE|nr:hypothetical protein L3Q82_000711 [Scortum barcoo]